MFANTGNPLRSPYRKQVNKHRVTTHNVFGRGVRICHWPLANQSKINLTRNVERDNNLFVFYFFTEVREVDVLCSRVRCEIQT